MGWAVIIIGAAILLFMFTRGGTETPVADTNTNAAAAETTNENVNAGETANTNAGTQDASAAFASLDTLLANYAPGEDCTATISRPGNNEVLLTFGLRRDGTGYDRVLTILKEAQVSAAFFTSGNWARAHADIIRAITDAGYPVYNQTQTHEDLTTLAEDAILTELEQGNETISGITGRSSKPFMRPPYGSINDEVSAAVKSAGYCPVLWSVDALDWQEGATSFDVISRVMGAVTTSGLVLMHIGSDPTPDALPEIIRRIREEGKSFVSLEQVATTQ